MYVQKQQFDTTQADFAKQEKFQTASQLAGGEFYGALSRAAKSWYPARSLVENGVTSRKQHDPSGRLIVFEEFAPWKVRAARDLRKEGHLLRQERSTGASVPA